MSEITWDIEGTCLLEEAIDYTQSPYKLKEHFKVHCIVVEEHDSGKLIAFYDGKTYVFDGRKYEEEVDAHKYTLEDYEPVHYEHRPLHDFPGYIRTNKPSKVIGHNTINYDHLVTKLYFGMEYDINPKLNGIDLFHGVSTEIVDTFILSKTLNPDRWCGHSLADLAKVAKCSQKIDFRPHIKKEERFKHFAADMLYYNIYDVKANAGVYEYLEWEKKDWNWGPAIALEKYIANLVTKQAHRGFKLNVEFCERNVNELDKLMEERKQLVEPMLPPKPATKKFMKEYTPPVQQLLTKEYTPPKTQFKKNGELSTAFLNFLEKHGGEILENNKKIKLQGKIYKLPISQDVVVVREIKASANLLRFAEKHNGKISEDMSTIEILGKKLKLPLPIAPLLTEEKANIDDSTHIKNWLIGEYGWKPLEYKDKDLSLKPGSKVKRTEEELEKAITRYVEETFVSNFKRDRLEHLGLKSNIHPTRVKSKLMERAKKRSLKVITNPSLTIGMDKQLCPNLELLSAQFPYAKAIVEYATYKHRRNSILGGGLEWNDEEEPEKGYMANLREDGRIGTPADTCGCACLTADTLIQTDTGLIPINKVCVRDKVITHEGRYRSVIDFIPNGIKDVYRIKLENGVEIKATDNHPFLSNKNWVQVKDLKKGDKVASYTSKEVWKQIPGFSNYFVSSWGRIFNNRGKEVTFTLETPKLRREVLHRRRTTELKNDKGERKKHAVGYFVLLAFEGERPVKTEVCHRDGNPTNNYLNNLYYGTSKENSADAIAHGTLQMHSRKKSKLSEEDVLAIKLELKNYVRGDCVRIAKKYRVSPDVISSIKNGTSWKEHKIYRQDFTTTTVISIEYLGQEPTYDITVEGDHSFVGNGTVLKNTSRMKHKKVANVPRVGTLYGAEMRELFGV